jgi:hypothetical protein
LEFDIGFLLDVNFLIRRAACAGFRTVIACPRPIRVSGDRKRTSYLLGHVPTGEHQADYGIWYARSKVVKPRNKMEVLKIRVT